jgi:hypothetical protein
VNYCILGELLYPVNYCIPIYNKSFIFSLKSNWEASGVGYFELAVQNDIEKVQTIQHATQTNHATNSRRRGGKGEGGG